MNMSEAIVSIQGLVKCFGRVRALDGVSLELAPGPVGLLGQNGAGKTTLLKVLLGLLEPDGGSVRIAGFDPRSRDERLLLRAKVGYMPESDCLIPRTSGVELLTMLARLSGLARDDARARAHEVLDYVGLDEARYRDCDGYSTGMKQRLKLAQALVHDPPVLLLDEPTNGLDPKGRAHMLDLVWDLGHVQAKSLLLCSHLLPDVERCCHDVIVLSKGRVAAQDSIDALTRTGTHRVRVVVTGDRTGFAASLRRRGLALEDRPDTLEVDLPTADCDVLFDAALEARIGLERVEPLRSTLEQAFLSTLTWNTTP